MILPLRDDLMPSEHREFVIRTAAKKNMPIRDVICKCVEIAYRKKLRKKLKKEDEKILVTYGKLLDEEDALLLKLQKNKKKLYHHLKDNLQDFNTTRYDINEEDVQERMEVLRKECTKIERRRNAIAELKELNPITQLKGVDKLIFETLE